MPSEDMGLEAFCSPPQIFTPHSHYHSIGWPAQKGWNTSPLHLIKKLKRGFCSRVPWVTLSQGQASSQLVSLIVMQLLPWVTWSGLGQRSPTPTAGYTDPCVKTSFPYNIQCFLSQHWPVLASQHTKRWRGWEEKPDLLRTHKSCSSACFLEERSGFTVSEVVQLPEPLKY